MSAAVAELRRRWAQWPSNPPPWTINDAVVAVVIAHFVFFLGGGLIVGLGGWKAGDIPQWAQLVAVTPFWIAIAVAALVNAGGPSGARYFGSTPQPVWVAIAVVAGAGLQLLLPLAYAPILWLTGTDANDLDAPARALVQGASGMNRAALIFMVCIGAPVFEELLFRGLLLRSMSHIRRVAAVGITSVLFAAAHFQLLQLPGLALFGVVAAVLSILGDSVAISAVAHISFNATALIALHLKYG